MTDDRRPRRSERPPEVHGRILSRKSPLTGADVNEILRFFGVSQRTLARHAGLGERTVQKICAGKSDGDIPLWLERVFYLYWVAPWTRHTRGRIQLPLRQWGIDRDDTSGDSETGVPTVMRTRAKEDMLSDALRRVMQSPDHGHAVEIATEALHYGRGRRKPNRTYEGATPADPFGSDSDETEDNGTDVIP